MGCPLTDAELEQHGACFGWAAATEELSPNTYLVGDIPRTAETHAEPFLVVRTDAGLAPDPFEDEQLMLLRSSKGLVLLLGCCHAGLINSLEHVRWLYPGERMRAVIGGLHLRSTDAENMDHVVDRLEAFSPALVAAGHCTGEVAEETLARRLGQRFQPLRCGTVIEL